MRKLIIGLVAVNVLGITAYLLFKPDPSESPAINPVKETVTTIETKSKEAAVSEEWERPQLMADTFESALGSLPESLKGTRIPFDLDVDEQNHLVISHSLRRLFDYFFTLVGEEEVPIIIQRIQDLLTRYLPEPASGEALDILRQYINLKEGEMALSQQMAMDFKMVGKQVDLQERVRLLRALRQSALSPEVYDAFFGQEDQRAEYSLKRHDILRDQNLSEEEREAALRELDQLLPDQVREAKEEEYQAQDLMREIKQARENGVSEASIMQMRTDVLGADAAERFAQADQKQSEWDQRIQVYRAERQSILESELSDIDRESEINRLREQHFSGPELMRIPVIDRMYDEEGKP